MNRWASKIIFPILQSHSATRESAYATYPASQPAVVLHRIAAEGRADVLNDIVRKLMRRGEIESKPLRPMLRLALMHSIREGCAAATRVLLLAYRAQGVALYAASSLPDAAPSNSIKEFIAWCVRDAMGAEFMDVLALSACTMSNNECALHALMRMPLSPLLVATVEALGPDSWSRASTLHATPLTMLIDEGDCDRIMALLRFIPADAFSPHREREHGTLDYSYCGRLRCKHASTPCRLVHVDISNLSLRVFREVLEKCMHAVPVYDVQELCRSLVDGDREDVHVKMLLVLNKFPSFDEKVAIVHASPPGGYIMENPPQFTTLANSISLNTDPAVLSLVLKYVVNPWNIWRSTKRRMRTSICTLLTRMMCHGPHSDPRSMLGSNVEEMLRILLECRHQGDAAEDADVYGDFYIGHESRYNDNFEVYMRHLSPEFLAHALETVPLGDDRHSMEDMCQFMRIAVDSGRPEVAKVLEAHLPDRGGARAYMEQHHVEDAARIYPTFAKRAVC